MEELEEDIVITLGEYIAWKQPDIVAKLWVVAYASISRAVRIYPTSFREWERVMQERPLPGRAGILSWEEVGF